MPQQLLPSVLLTHFPDIASEHTYKVPYLLQSMCLDCKHLAVLFALAHTVDVCNKDGELCRSHLRHQLTSRPWARGQPPLQLLSRVGLLNFAQAVTSGLASHVAREPCTEKDDGVQLVAAWLQALHAAQYLMVRDHQAGVARHGPKSSLHPLRPWYIRPSETNKKMTSGQRVDAGLCKSNLQPGPCGSSNSATQQSRQL